MDLIIVRHARPERDERTEGDPADPGLSDLGHCQAQITADFLATEGITHVASSSMLRARQTAAPLAERLGVDLSLHDSLREVDQHSHRYVPMEELTDDDQVVIDYLDDPWSLFDGDFGGFRDRVVDGFDTIIDANRGGTVAVFCHGMVMGVYLMSLLGTENPFGLQADYCGIVRIRASSTGLRTIRSVNETGHVRDTLE